MHRVGSLISKTLSGLALGAHDNPLHDAIEVVKAFKDQLIDELPELNSVAIAELSGACGPKKAMFVYVPHGQSDLKTLTRCYEKIFSFALDDGATSIAIPTFSIGENEYDPYEAARIAVRAAADFIMFIAEYYIGKEFEIKFVIYKSNKGKIDVINAAAYQKALSEVCIPLNYRERIIGILGEIERQEADLAVIPVGKNKSMDKIWDAFLAVHKKPYSKRSHFTDLYPELI